MSSKLHDTHDSLYHGGGESFEVQKKPFCWEGLVARRIALFEELGAFTSIFQFASPVFRTHHQVSLEEHSKVDCEPIHQVRTANSFAAIQTEENTEKTEVSRLESDHYRDENQPSHSTTANFYSTKVSADYRYEVSAPYSEGENDRLTNVLPTTDEIYPAKQDSAQFVDSLRSYVDIQWDEKAMKRIDESGFHTDLLSEGKTDDKSLASVLQQSSSESESLEVLPGLHSTDTIGVGSFEGLLNLQVDLSKLHVARFPDTFRSLHAIAVANQIMDLYPLFKRTQDRGHLPEFVSYFLNAVYFIFQRQRLQFCTRRLMMTRDKNVDLSSQLFYWFMIHVKASRAVQRNKNCTDLAILSFEDEFDWDLFFSVEWGWHETGDFYWITRKNTEDYKHLKSSARQVLCETLSSISAEDKAEMISSNWTTESIMLAIPRIVQLLEDGNERERAEQS